MVNIANIATARQFYSTDIMKIPQGGWVVSGARGHGGASTGRAAVPASLSIHTLARLAASRRAFVQQHACSYQGAESSNLACPCDALVQARAAALSGTLPATL